MIQLMRREGWGCSWLLLTKELDYEQIAERLQAQVMRAFMLTKEELGMTDIKYPRYPLTKSSTPDNNIVHAFYGTNDPVPGDLFHCGLAHHPHDLGYDYIIYPDTCMTFVRRMNAAEYGNPCHGCFGMSPVVLHKNPLNTRIIQMGEKFPCGSTKSSKSAMKGVSPLVTREVALRAGGSRSTVCESCFPDPKRERNRWRIHRFSEKDSDGNIACCGFDLAADENVRRRALLFDSTFEDAFNIGIPCEGCYPKKSAPPLPSEEKKVKNTTLQDSPVVHLSEFKAVAIGEKFSCGTKRENLDKQRFVVDRGESTEELRARASMWGDLCVICFSENPCGEKVLEAPEAPGENEYNKPKEVVGRWASKEPNTQELPKPGSPKALAEEVKARQEEKKSCKVCDSIPKKPNVECCGTCGEELRLFWTLKTGLVKGCDEHGLQIPHGPVCSLTVDDYVFNSEHETSGDVWGRRYSPSVEITPAALPGRRNG
jgi:hypothetical protein